MPSMDQALMIVDQSPKFHVLVTEISRNEFSGLCSGDCDGPVTDDFRWGTDDFNLPVTDACLLCID